MRRKRIPLALLATCLLALPMQSLAGSIYLFEEGSRSLGGEDATCALATGDQGTGKATYAYRSCGTAQTEGFALPFHWQSDMPTGGTVIVALELRNSSAETVCVTAKIICDPGSSVTLKEGTQAAQAFTTASTGFFYRTFITGPGVPSAPGADHMCWLKLARDPTGTSCGGGLSAAAALHIRSVRIIY